LKFDHLISDIVPEYVKFRNNEILQLDFNQKLILGDSSLRHTYDKLILACGLEPNFTTVSGLLYSLNDKSNPIFTIYEYENVIPKMTNYSLYLAQLIIPENEYKLSKTNDDFFKFGNGNIVFSNATENIYEILYNIQMILLLYNVVKVGRKLEYFETLKYYITFPITEESFFKNVSEIIANYFLKELKEKKIEIKWNYQLTSVESQCTLGFKKNGKLIEKIEYNYAFIMPQLKLPSFLEYSDINKNGEIILDNDKFTVRNSENSVYLIGDCLRSDNYLDRFETNIFNQASILSKILKTDYFRLSKTQIPIYKPYSTVCFDYDPYLYHFFNTEENIYRKLTKSYWNNFLFKHLYHRPEGFYAKNMLLKRKFGFKL